MPDAFTQSLHPAVWEFLVRKKQAATINDQMRSHFCEVDLSSAEVKLRPSPALLKQKGLTANHINSWSSNATRAFQSVAAKYKTFECGVNASVWKAAEEDIRLAAKDDLILLHDRTSGVVAVAGLAKDVDHLQRVVEGIVQKASSRIERERDGVSEGMDLSPGMYDILQQRSLHQKFASSFPDLSITYRADIRKLVLTGLPAEVFSVKSWVLESQLNMRQRQLEVDPSLLGFLSLVDSEEVSQNIFTSRDVNAVFKMEKGEVVLLGSSERDLTEAEKLLKNALSFRHITVEDLAVMSKSEWLKLKAQLMDTYNTSKKNTVSIKLSTENCITVSGFCQPVREVSDKLSDFINKHSRVDMSVPVRSRSMLKFIQDNKASAWKPRVDPREVQVDFDSRKRRIVLRGARMWVQEVKSLFQQIVSALCTDHLTIIKPGAKKYFLEEGRDFVSMLMNENHCMVLLQEEEEEEELPEEEQEENASLTCQVHMDHGVLITVNKADICHFVADAVVNAANEDLKHIGGLAAALLSAAGPRLQDVSDQYVRAKGRLNPGEAAITEAGRLRCKHVIHAVGPRYSSSDRNRSISLLSSAVRRSLALAAQHGCSSIALPAISSGIFGFPLDLCADTIARAVCEHCKDARPRGTSLTKIHLVNNDDKTVRAMTQAVRTVFANEDLELLSERRSPPMSEQQRPSQQR
ncbi:hypothetical protein MATL_G00046010 [Megalops atlanticus]|uniref:Macro domain-containing protein n=1 Tax=Megalops atlanticus TaxID=7932 RepID=A0A9D3QAJ1_MEGAT|nr:hypothetical protein MATL_G00046010 [Megalops atlanticus]